MPLKRAIEAQKALDNPVEGLKAPPDTVKRVTDLFPPAAQTMPPKMFRHNFHNKPLPKAARQRLHDSTAVVAALERLVRTLGSVSNTSRHLNMSRPFLSMVLSGSRLPSRELCEALGYVPVLMYARAFSAERDSWAAAELAAEGNDGQNESD